MRTRFLVLAAITGISLAGCGSARRGEPFAGPLPVESPEVAQGQKVFSFHCDQCHPGGEAGVGPSINEKPLPGFMIRLQVRNGLGAMPSFPEEVIGAQDLDALIAYAQALRGHE